MQANGFDCGLFVTKFAEMVLRRQPGSSAADIADKFATLLPVSDFSQQDVDLEREEMRRLINRWAVWLTLSNTHIQNLLPLALQDTR